MTHGLKVSTHGSSVLSGALLGRNIVLDAAGRVSVWKSGRRGKGGSRKEKGNKESGRERRRGRKKTQQTPKPLSIKYTSAFIRYSVSGIV